MEGRKDGVTLGFLYSPAGRRTGNWLPISRNGVKKTLNAGMIRP
jgi:hypothetical protein